MSANIAAKRRAVRFREFQREQKNSYRTGGCPIACGKACHASKSEAKRAIRRAIGDGNMWGKELMSHYWCGKCSAWHIGHSRPREERKPDDLIP
jgi:hypothetical protein